MKKTIFLLMLVLIALIAISKSGYSQRNPIIPLDEIKFWLSTSEKYKEGYYKVHASYLEKEATLNFQSKGPERALCRNIFFNMEKDEIYGEHQHYSDTKYYLIMKSTSNGTTLKPDFPEDARAMFIPRCSDPRAGIPDDTIVIFIPGIIKEGGKEGLQTE